MADAEGAAAPPTTPADAEPAAPGRAQAGLRERLSRRVGASGSTGELLDTENDAISGFQIRAGQVFGGNSYVYNMTATGAAVRVCRLSAEELDELREAFVRSAEHDAHLREIRSRPVTMLRGPAGAGKEALARALLYQAGHRRLYLIDPDTDLGAISADDLQQGAGYVLADLPQRAADSVKGFQLRHIGQEFSKKDCRLVVTVSAAVQFSDAEIVRELREAPAQPEGVDIARAQLQWRLGIAEAARGRRILDRPEIAQLLRNEVDGAPAARAAQLGRILAEAAVAVTEAEVEGVVRSRLEQSDGRSFGHWLENVGDLASQCLAISVAAFGGEAYASVASLALNLENRLQVEESPDNPSRPRGTPFTRTGSARLEAIHASLVESDVGTRHGGARGLVVRFRDPGVAVKLLEHVWSEYDAIREVLPGWLRDSASRGLPTVGVRAAVAAGVLAEHAFEAVRAKILLPWAADEREDLREAAAGALRMVATDAAHAPAAYNLVHAWSTSSSPALQATAARAWRVVFERDGTEEAWAFLHGLAGVEKELVGDAVCRSLVDYMAIEDGRHCRDALDLIDQWAVSGRHGAERRRAGEFAFLYAAADLLAPLNGTAGSQPAPPAGREEPLWPALLARTVRNPEELGEIAALWKQTVNSRYAYEAAHMVLTEWAFMAEPVEQQRTALALLLGAAADDPRTTLIIRHLATKWQGGTDGRSAPATARAVLARLDGRRSS